MRLFIGIELDNGARALLAREADALRTHMRGNFSLPENYHITLAFLGQHEPEELPDIRAALDAAAAQRKPLSLELRGLGCFPSGSKMIVWHGLAHNPALMQLQEKLCAELRARDVDFQPGEYHPHITLARQCPAGALPGDMCGAVRLNVQRITLFESGRVDGVLRYTPLYRAGLGGK